MKVNTFQNQQKAGLKRKQAATRQESESLNKHVFTGCLVKYKILKTQQNCHQNTTKPLKKQQCKDMSIVKVAAGRNSGYSDETGIQ